MFGKSRQQQTVQRRVQKEKTPSWNFALFAILMAGGAMIGAYAAPNAGSLMSSSLLPTSLNSDCVIKGNISINSGEKIYHMPGQEYYSATRIRPEYGERWFCTEAGARSAGWRKAGR